MIYVWNHSQENRLKSAVSWKRAPYVGVYRSFQSITPQSKNNRFLMGWNIEKWDFGSCGLEMEGNGSPRLPCREDQRVSGENVTSSKIRWRKIFVRWIMYPNFQGKRHTKRWKNQKNPKNITKSCFDPLRQAHLFYQNKIQQLLYLKNHMKSWKLKLNSASFYKIFIAFISSL